MILHTDYLVQLCLTLLTVVERTEFFYVDITNISGVLMFGLSSK